MAANTNQINRGQPSTPASRRWLRRLVVASAVVTGVGVADLGLTWASHADEVEALKVASPGVTNQMRHFEVIPQLDWKPLSAIPGLLACAVVIAEDSRFLDYAGVNWIRQREIFTQMVRGKATGGGSGITQQLVRNLYLSPRVTPRRKVREWILAIQLGRRVPHERQLELYLNVSQWGPTAWGASAGARELLGKALDSITPADAVILAMSLPAPSRGLGYSLHPRRTGEVTRIVQQLWTRGALDDVQASATIARLERILLAVSNGKSGRDAIGIAAAEMGDELPWRGPSIPALSCTTSARRPS
jgi:membrane peptidoglycan carboxypeptidase